MTDEELYDEYLISKNTMTVAEFEKFLPLYQKDNQLTYEERISLNEQLNKDIDLFTPLRVIDPVTDKVIYEFPAIYVRVPTLNNLDTDIVDGMIASYNKAMLQTSNPISLEPAIATNNMKQCFQVVNNIRKDELIKQLDEYTELSDNIVGDRKVNSGFDISDDGWEDD